MPPQPQAESPDSHGQKAPSKGKRRLIVIVGVIVLGLVVIAAGLWYWHSRFYESTDDAYVAGHPILVSARISGNVVGVHVRDNQHVETGALLVEIDPCDYETALAQAQAAVQAAQAIEKQSAAEVEVAKATLTREQQDLHRYEELAKTNAVAIQDLQHSQASTAVAQANLNAAEKRLAAARAQIAQAKAASDQARLQLSYAWVHAPEAGYVTQKAVEAGSYLAKGQSLLAIVTDEMYVTANFKETQLTHMRPDQPVTVAVDTYPGVHFNAHVDSIQAGTGAVFSLFPPENATGNFVKIVQRVPVKIVFDEPPDPNHRLVLGMSVEPTVRVR
jgi:membrane fusion protein (multidrug efflux system)